MPFRNLTFASLFIYLVSLAATQTAYGQSFLPLRWISLIALCGLGAFSWFTKDRHTPMPSVNMRVVVYLFLWGLTAINGAYPLFSGYRLFAHAMVVISGLVFLPQIVRLIDASRLLTVLKVLIAVTLIFSLLRPAPLTSLDASNQYRGIFGNANSLGHIAAVGCLLYVHGFLTKIRKQWGLVQLALMALAGVLLIRSGARSSAVALLSGLLVLLLIYKKQSSRKVFLGWTLVIGASLVLVALPTQIERFAFKGVTSEGSSSLNRLTESRTETWSNSWNAFKERPILGWGFGVDSETDLSDWNGQWSALGYTTRDPLNDITYTLETGGIVGFLAYFFILSLALKLRVPSGLMTKLKTGLQPTEYKLAESALDVQQAFLSLSILLIVLFEFDDTALSAGYFLAALLWISLGLSLVLRSLLTYDLPQQIIALYFGRREPSLVRR